MIGANSSSSSSSSQARSSSQQLLAAGSSSREVSRSPVRSSGVDCAPALVVRLVVVLMQKDAGGSHITVRRSEQPALSCAGQTPGCTDYNSSPLETAGGETGWHTAARCAQLHSKLQPRSILYLSKSYSTHTSPNNCIHIKHLCRYFARLQRQKNYFLGYVIMKRERLSKCRMYERSISSSYVRALRLLFLRST